MNELLLIALPGNETCCEGLASALGAEVGRLTARRFPDEESYLCFETALDGRSVVLICTLDRPDAKLAQLLFAAAAARDLGAKGVGLVAPYLAYMRQDRRFQKGEAVTSEILARLLSENFDWLVTVDPHLHRHSALGEVFKMPTQVVHAAPLISAWISREVQRPLLVGPDAESEQWVTTVAHDAGAPYVILRKIRHGDRDVEVRIPNMTAWQDRTPVLIDDIISTGRTMIETIGHLRRAGMALPVCIGVHAIFAGNALADLTAAGARIISANTIRHETNAIDVIPKLAEATEAFR